MQDERWLSTRALLEIGNARQKDKSLYISACRALCPELCVCIKSSSSHKCNWKLTVCITDFPARSHRPGESQLCVRMWALSRTPRWLMEVCKHQECSLPEWGGAWNKQFVLDGCQRSDPEQTGAARWDRDKEIPGAAGGVLGKRQWAQERGWGQDQGWGFPEAWK